jgi:hypothetical protein
LQLLSRPRRPARSGEWTTGAAIMFIVTLAARRSVTLAAKASGMSRKSAYALRARDPAFAEAWAAALSPLRKTAEKPALCGSEGDNVKPSAPSIWSSRPVHTIRAKHDAMRRDRFFARLAMLGSDSNLARPALEQ